MKLDIDKFYIVYKPTPVSEMVDIFSGQANDLNGLFLQFQGGLKPEQIHGIYTSVAAAQKDADKLLKQPKGSQQLQTFAIYTADLVFKFKKQFANQAAVETYLNATYAKGKSYAAYKLSDNPKKVTKAQLKRFKKEIDTASLNHEDLENLMQLYVVLESNPAAEGMILAHSFDTFLREFTPSAI